LAAVDWLEWWTAGRVVATAAVAQLVVVGWAALYARSQVREARTLREEQARPFVVVDLERWDQPFVNLVVANLGKTMARNVRISFDPPLESSFDKKAPVPVGQLKLFTAPIPSLAPSKRIEFLFDSLRERPKELPSAYRATLRYEGERGPLPVDTQYLDLDQYRNLLEVTRYTIHDVYKVLDRMGKRMDDWTATLGGLLVLTPDDVRRRHEDIRVEREAEDAPTEGHAAGNGRYRLMGQLVEVISRLRRG
jgi:hypothetical protein